MGFNKQDRAKVEKLAASKGYGWNSDGTKMVKGDKKLVFSPSGGSARLNDHGSPYNDHASIKKSKWW